MERLKCILCFQKCGISCEETKGGRLVEEELCPKKLFIPTKIEDCHVKRFVEKEPNVPTRTDL